MANISKEEFIKQAENSEFVTISLSFDKCIDVELEGDNINQTACDFFKYRQKSMPEVIQFSEFKKDVKYFLIRGCKITNLNVQYKGSPWRRFQTWARKHTLNQMKTINDNNNVL